MARFRHLPIWKDAMDLALHLEHAVRRFPRYHKYTLGSELRQTAHRLCRLVARVNDAQGAGRLHVLDELVHAVEEMKTLLTLAKETGASGLPALCRRLRRSGQAYVLAAQTGHFRTGFRRREIVEFWYPPAAAAAQAFFSATDRGDR